MSQISTDLTKSLPLLQPTGGPRKDDGQAFASRLAAEDEPIEHQPSSKPDAKDAKGTTAPPEETPAKPQQDDQHQHSEDGAEQANADDSQAEQVVTEVVVAPQQADQVVLSEEALLETQTGEGFEFQTGTGQSGDASQQDAQQPPTDASVFESVTETAAAAGLGEEAGAATSQVEVTPEPTIPTEATDTTDAPANGTELLDGDAALAAQEDTADQPTKAPPVVPQQSGKQPQSPQSSEQSTTTDDQPQAVTAVQDDSPADENTDELPDRRPAQQQETNRRGSEGNADFQAATNSQATESNAPSEEPLQPTDASAPKEQPADTRTAADPPQHTSRSLDRIATGRFLSSRAEGQPSVDQAGRVDATRFVGRVEKAFQTANAQGGGPVRIRLSPPELGAMQIRLSVTPEGHMNAQVETETTAARNVLLDNLPALRERLASMEIRVEKFDVDVQHQGRGQQDAQQNGTPDEFRGERDQSQDGSGRRGRTPQDAGGEQLTPNRNEQAGLIGPDQINLVA